MEILQRVMDETATDDDDSYYAIDVKVVIVLSDVDGDLVCVKMNIRLQNFSV